MIDRLHSIFVNRVIDTYGKDAVTSIYYLRQFEYKHFESSTSLLVHLNEVQQYVANVKKKYVPDQKKKIFSQHLRTMIVDCVRNDKLALNLCMISSTFMEQLYFGDSPLMLWIAMVKAIKYNIRRYKRQKLSFTASDMELPKDISKNNVKESFNRDIESSRSLTKTESTQQLHPHDKKDEIRGDVSVSAYSHVPMIDESTSIAAVKTIDPLYCDCIAFES